MSVFTQLRTRYTLILLTIMGFAGLSCMKAQSLQPVLSLTPENISLWTTSKNGSFILKKNEAESGFRGNAPEYKLYWDAEDDSTAGRLISPVFTITEPLQIFDIAGIPGNLSDGSPGSFSLRLRLAGDSSLVRECLTNGYSSVTSEHWRTPELIGKEVYLEVYAPVLKGFLGSSDIWMALENYRQESPDDMKNIRNERLYGLKIDKNALLNYCRSIPFLTAHPGPRGETARESANGSETIPVNARAEVVYLLGLINHGWENGVAHWSEHPEMLEDRSDQVYAGKKLGVIRIEYADNSTDSIPLIFGSTLWYSNHWAHGGSHDVAVPSREPFDSRPELMKILRTSLRVKEDNFPASLASDHKHFYLPFKPADKEISNIIIVDNQDTRGVPLISGITLKGRQHRGLVKFEKTEIAVEDLQATIDLRNPPDYHKDAAIIAGILYNRDEDLPEDPMPIEIPETLDATGIKFYGGKEAAWLSNIWAANLVQIHEKFDSKTGYFRETGEDCPWYGGYSGLGTWCYQGIYPAAYSRTSDHFVTLAMRHIHEPQRETSYVDFCDKWLYFFRTNHDPEKGPPNPNMKIDKYPEDAPPHWSMELSNPPTTGGLININEIFGDEEMDGHAATIVGRWYAWKLQGGGTGSWLMENRESIYNKSRWESSRDATEFICWLMDYTGRDLVYSEGEFTGWGGIVDNYCLVPENMSEETDPVKIRENYANANMYEPYPNYACMTALICAAEMADAAGETTYADKWRSYAETIRKAMVRQLIANERNKLTWRISPYSILTTFQDRLVQAWFSLYKSGLDSKKWDQKMLELTRNSFEEHIQMAYGYSPALAMGYGQGWITHAAIVLDEMDHGSKLLVNMAKYCYDKNMDFVDPNRNTDWRKWTWIVPEGVNVLPDGSWHRINDLSNGANQGPVMHAIEACAGVDDSNPEKILIMPRIPDPLEGIGVTNHTVLIESNGKLVKNRISYSFRKNDYFEMTADMNIPELAIRLGPWNTSSQAKNVMKKLQDMGFDSRIEDNGSYSQSKAWWVWAEKIRNTGRVKLDLQP